MPEIWFWQVIISPHMADLAVVLARRGCKITYVAQRAMSVERAKQGWKAPTLPGVTLQLADSSAAVKMLVEQASADSIHICQGVRANGSVGLAQTALAARGLRQWVVMESVNDSGWRGAFKRMEYSRIFRAREKSLQGVLATGYRTVDWVVARGVPSDKVYPFAYFLPDRMDRAVRDQRKPGPIRFLFAGQLIPRKRVDWLVNVLADLMDQSFELWIVGAGPEEAALRSLAAGKLGNRVRWLGQLSLPDVPAVMAQADCLVLPSMHDGWGAVASEALMVGTPVICSDACGVAGVVKASGAGGVFGVSDSAELHRLLDKQCKEGIVDTVTRVGLKEWASCLGSIAGANYLLKILASLTDQAVYRVAAPWHSSKGRQ